MTATAARTSGTTPSGPGLPAESASDAGPAAVDHGDAAPGPTNADVSGAADGESGITVSRQAELHTLIPPGSRPRSGGLGAPIELPGPGTGDIGGVGVQRSIQPAAPRSAGPTPVTPPPSFPGAELPIVQRSRSARHPGTPPADGTTVVAPQPEPSHEPGSALPVQRSAADATTAGTLAPGGADAGGSTTSAPEQPPAEAPGEPADRPSDAVVVPTLGAGAAALDDGGPADDANAAAGVTADELVAMPVASVQRRSDTGADSTPPSPPPSPCCVPAILSTRRPRAPALARSPCRRAASTPRS